MGNYASGEVAVGRASRPGVRLVYFGVQPGWFLSDSPVCSVRRPTFKPRGLLGSSRQETLSVRPAGAAVSLSPAIGRSHYLRRIPTHSPNITYCVNGGEAANQHWACCVNSNVMSCIYEY